MAPRRIPCRGRGAARHKALKPARASPVPSSPGARPRHPALSARARSPRTLKPLWLPQSASVTYPTEYGQDAVPMIKYLKFHPRFLPAMLQVRPPLLPPPPAAAPA